MSARGESGAAADLAYCRAALPLVSRTFAANIGVLKGSMARSVPIAYLMCRIADTLEDSWPTEGRVAERFDLWLDAIEGESDAVERLAASAAAFHAERADLEMVAHAPTVLRAFGALPAAERHVIGATVREMTRGMRRYAVRAAERRGDARATGERVGGAMRAVASPDPENALPDEILPYLDTEAELHDYCFIVAGGVGEMLTRLFAQAAPVAEEIEAERLALAPIVGEALQLTNILLDWPRDLARGRCYLPAEWLAQYQLSPAELADAGRVGAMAAARRLEALARAALGQVPEYLDLIPSRFWRYRMFVLWPALWAAASLRHAFRDATFPLGPDRPRLPRSEVRSIARRALLFGHSRAGVRRLFAGVG